MSQKRSRARYNHEDDTEDLPDGLDPITLAQKRSRARYNHEDDTEDIPDGLDPISLAQRKKKWTHVNDHYDQPKAAAEPKAAAKPKAAAAPKKEAPKEAAKAASFV
mmetsp:Transcript_38178/g.58237  ORF Transcript_38178/g.58237 Transcript_38178/m.58237 type:complete len:106 (+) Transcript_38178:763-1080(+)